MDVAALDALPDCGCVIGRALLDQARVPSFAISILRSFFDEVPRDLDDASRVDGCTPLITQ